LHSGVLRDEQLYDCAVFLDAAGDAFLSEPTILPCNNWHLKGNLLIKNEQLLRGSNSCSKENEEWRKILWSKNEELGINN
jgi:hypothetical protein